MKSKVVEIYKKEKKTGYNSRLGIVFDGEDNLRSLAAQNLIKSSQTATQCANLLNTFLKGNGFENPHKEINLSNVTFRKKSLNSLLSNMTKQVSRQRGCFIHVQYNGAYEKTSLKVIPFTRCRIGKKDSKDYFGKIIVSQEGWSNRINKDKIDVFDVYNPTPSAIQSQVDKAGGWGNYKGQIYYLNLDEENDYPESPIEPGYLYADGESNLGLYYNSSTKRGFKNVPIVRHKAFPTPQAEDDFFDGLEKVYGGENAGSILGVEDSWEQDGNKDNNVKFDYIEDKSDTKKYEHLETAFANAIRKGFYNAPTQLLEATSGKLGNTTGEDLKMWNSIYNTFTADPRERIEDCFKELFTNFKTPVNTEGLNIIQFSIYSDGTTNQ